MPLLYFTHIAVEFTLNHKRSVVQCLVSVGTVERTGVEMEALTAVSIALLAIYDMCKGVDRSMTLTNIRLLEKLGGRSGHWQSSKP